MENNLKPSPCASCAESETCTITHCDYFDNWAKESWAYIQSLYSTNTVKKDTCSKLAPSGMSINLSNTGNWYDIKVCPKCHQKVSVADSRTSKDFSGIIRRRVCQKCHTQFYTAEVTLEYLTRLSNENTKSN